LNFGRQCKLLETSNNKCKLCSDAGDETDMLLVLPLPLLLLLLSIF